MSNLWSSVARAQRAYADRAGRRHPAAPPRPHPVRARGPGARPAAAARGVAAQPAAPPIAVAAAAATWV